MSIVFLCAKRGVIGGRTDRTKDIKLSLIQLRVKKKKLQNWKYLHSQIVIQEGKTMIWKKPNFPKILSKETTV